MLKLLSKQKSKEKFYVSILSCLNILLKVNILKSVDDETLKGFIDIIYEVSKTTKSIQKLMISAQVLPMIFVSLEVGKEQIKEYINIIDSFFFKEYPIIRT